MTKMRILLIIIMVLLMSCEQESNYNKQGVKKQKNISESKSNVVDGKKEMIVAANKNITDKRTIGGYMGGGNRESDLKKEELKWIKFMNELPRPENESKEDKKFREALGKEIARELFYNKKGEGKLRIREIPDFIMEKEQIDNLNADFSFILDNNKKIKFHNVIWEYRKKEEIKNYLNGFVGEKVKIYYSIDRLSNMGDYRIKKDKQGCYLIKDIKDNNNNSVLEELRKRNLIKEEGG